MKEKEKYKLINNNKTNNNNITKSKRKILCKKNEFSKMSNSRNKLFKILRIFNNLRNKCSIRNYYASIMLFNCLFVQLVFHTALAQDDRRCFLEKGGSVQNFFVPESLSVGDEIGDLRIVGDASRDGDIYLRLEEPNSSPVRISPNSKKLILTEKLDKEGKEGRAHIVISVICQKRKTDDVDTKIPINIRVIDTNDNSPIFVKAPYYVNVSEATVKNTKIVGDIRAYDEDQKGPFSDIHYSVAKGPYSNKFSFETPMSGTLQLREALDYETDPIFNITIVAEDRGNPPRRTETFVTVQVIDSDDQNPVFGRQRYMAFLPTNPVKGRIVDVQPEQIFAVDQDKGIRAPVFYTLGKDVFESSYLNIDPESGEISLVQDVPDDQFLQPVALSVIATQVDNPDRVVTTILTISRRGSTSKQLQFLQRIYEKTINENLPKGTLIADTLINKKPINPIRFYLERGGMGVFKITPNGEIYLDYELDYEKEKEYNLKIYVTDGLYNDTAVLRVKVLNINDWDPRFMYPQYTFYVEKEDLQPGDSIGNVTVADGDGDDISFTIRGRDARMFSVTPLGEIIVKRLISLNTTEANIVLEAKDSGKPPRQSSVPVRIFLPRRFIEALPLGASSSFLLMVVFGSLVAVFILVIICLAAYIHKNKKIPEDKNAAMPTKMNHIITNGGPNSKLDPLSVLNHHHQNDAGSDITSIEAPKSNGSILEANNPFRRTYTNGSLRASTISVTSNDHKSLKNAVSPQGSKRYSRNPLINGVHHESKTHVKEDGGDSLSLNGSNATTTSTATGGSESPPNIGSRSQSPHSTLRFYGQKMTPSISPLHTSLSTFCSYDGTARATGGLPNNHSNINVNNNNNGNIPPAPPAPPFHAKVLHSKSTPPDRASSSSSDVGSERRYPTTKLPAGIPESRRICWPPSTIPKKVKKLSWEDELNNQTELNPEVSVTPMPQNSHSMDSPNLTVYF